MFLQTRIIPMPIPIHSGGSGGNPNIILALYIVAGSITFLWFLFHVIKYVLIRNGIIKYDVYAYQVNTLMYYLGSSNFGFYSFYSFCFVHGIALFIFIVMQVYNAIQ